MVAASYQHRAAYGVDKRHSFGYLAGWLALPSVYCSNEMILDTEEISTH